MSVRTGLGTNADQAAAPEPESRSAHLGTVVAVSLAAGLVAAVTLPFLPVGTVDVNFSTAMVLFGFALGWSLLALLSGAGRSGAPRHRRGVRANR